MLYGEYFVEYYQPHITLLWIWIILWLPKNLPGHWTWVLALGRCLWLVFLIGPLHFEWYVVGWGSKSKHHHKDTCWKDWRSNFQFVVLQFFRHRLPNETWVVLLCKSTWWKVEMLEEWDPLHHGYSRSRAKRQKPGRAGGSPLLVLPTFAACPLETQGAPFPWDENECKLNDWPGKWGYEQA